MFPLKTNCKKLTIFKKAFSVLQLIFLFSLQENELRKALIPFIGIKLYFYSTLPFPA